MLKRLFIGLFSFLLTTALAFTWTPNQVPPGNHSYVLEIRNTSEDQEDQVTTIQIDIQETDGAYTVDSSYTFSQTNLSQDDLSEAIYGGSVLGMFALGPMLMYGPSFMLLPMMLGNEDIRVRSEPMIVMGMGKIYMNETVQVAGRECVVLRFEANDNPDEPIEFALAEDLPFPCFSRYNNNDGSFMEIRLISAD